MLQIGRSLVRSQMVSLEFFIDIKSFWSHYGPGVDSASNRNEYQKHFLWGKGGRCLRLTTLPLSCAVVTKPGKLNFLKPSGPLQACNGTDLPFFQYKNIGETKVLCIFKIVSILTFLKIIRLIIIIIISNLSNDRYKASSKTIPPHSAI